MENLIIIGDFLKDLDDEHTLIAASELKRQGFIKILCVVGNLAPAQIRARGAKGTLKVLGCGDIPVGIGLPVFEGKNYPYETDIPYLAGEREVEPGYDLLVRTLEAQDDKSVTLLLISGLTDAAKLAFTGTLIERKVKHVVIMGGVEVENGKVKRDHNGFMIPNNANNNSFHMASAIFLFSRLQDLKIPMTIVTREVAYAASVPFTMYDKMMATGNPVGICLRNRQKPALQHLWEAACSEPDSEIRGTLPNDRNREWFIKVFCGGVNIPVDLPNNDIWPFVESFNLYDPTALYAAVPEISRRFYEPTEVLVGNATHYVIGISSQNHGVKNVPEFIQFMVDTEVKGLSN